MHQTKKYDSIKWNPRKLKWKTMIYSGIYETNKGKRRLTHLSYTIVLPLLANTSGAADCE